MTTVLEQPTRMFDGWADAKTGARVLRIDVCGDRDSSMVRQTVYEYSGCRTLAARAQR
jgi:hypothetical protein